MKKNLTIKRLQILFAWIFATSIVTLMPFYKASAQTTPVVPVTVDKFATPVINPLDPNNPNAWDITLSIETGTVIQTTDVVIVFDKSYSMKFNNRLVKAKEAARLFIRKMLPDNTATENVRVALVVFNKEATTASGFTNDSTALCNLIKNITINEEEGYTHTQSGLKAARDLLASSVAMRKHIVLLSDGEANRQYKLKNPRITDQYVNKTGDELVAAITPTPDNNQYYSRKDLDESRYDYNQTAGYLNHSTIHVFDSGIKRYYYFPCNAAVNEAQFAKNGGSTIHSIGLDVGNIAIATMSLKQIATTEDHYYPVDPLGLITAFDNIANNIKMGIDNGVVNDNVAPGFVLGEGNIPDLITVSQGTVSYNADTNTITWMVGNMGKLKTATLTYRIYADIDNIGTVGQINTTSQIGPDVGGYDTNTVATLTYTNSNGVPNQQMTFPRPTVKVGYGVIKRHYVMVNANGQPILADGTVVSSLSQAHILHPQDFFLPEGSEYIAPKWIKLDKNNDNLQNYSVTPIKTSFIYNGKLYTLTTVNGSTPSGGEVGISWQQPVGNAYFAYKEGLPPVVPVEVDKYAIPVENPLDPENPNAWDVTLKISTGAATIPVDVVLVIDQSSSMSANGRMDAAIASGQEFVRKMLPKGVNTEAVRVALVSYHHAVFLRSDFTRDTTLLCSEIRKLKPIWGTHTQAGLKMARNIMKNSSAPRKYIVLMSDGNATQQYKLNNPQISDFMGMTGDPNDPTDIVINGGVVNPGAFLADNSSTPLAPQQPTYNSKVSRPDLPESKYDYGNIFDEWNFVTFDGTSGPLVYEPLFGAPYYYYAPTNAAINEATFAKNEGYEIFTIGYDLNNWNLPIEALRRTATDDDHFIEATPEQLAGVFNDIAESISIGIQQGTVVDFVAPGFIVKNVTESGDVTHLFNVSQGIVHYNINTKTLTWDPGTVLSSTDATITYRIYADLDYIQNNDIPVNTASDIGPDLGGFDTNTEATLTYTNSNGDPGQQLVFPRPTVKLGYGVIKRHYVLVNKEGQPIQANGTVVNSLSEAYVLQPQDFFLPTGGDHIAPKWIKLDKSTEALQYYSVTPSNTIITTADGKRYSFVEVTNSTPNPGQIGISWKKPAGNAYFAYRVLNYWMGGTENHVNEWNVTTNWTGDQVPLTGEDVEFATTENFGTPAVDDLHVPTTDPKVIGNLINNSGKDLVVTTGSQLTINGVVEDNNTNAGTIVVKSSKDNPTGTLLFANPGDNQNVGATVEFYNQGYDCADCGMYRRSWQYFGIPVNESDFPINDVAGNETINQWVEPFNGDKWRPAPYAPDTKLQKFKGYQITNDVQTQPTGVYSFKGTICMYDAFLNLTRTSDVNYSGANLIGNSYTAAIDIKQGIVFPSEVEQTVYLFNTGTRDQWRKLNGSMVSGYQAGQYLSVPKHMAGQGNLPDRIPSMHSFLVKMLSGSSCTMTISYDKLLKNTTVDNGNGTQIAWRSGNSGSANMPSLVMDVLGNESADRLWIFTDAGLSFGFDNGWDGRKLTEKGLSQLYAMSDIGNDKFQVAAVPELDNLLIGFDADKDGQYTLEFALSDHFAKGAVCLHDFQTGAKHRITNSTSYSFVAKRGDSGARFRLSYGCDENGDDLHVVSTNGREIIILNQDALDCTVTLFTIEGKLLRYSKVLPGHREVMKVQTRGAYIVHLQNAFTNDVHKVLVEY